VSVIEDSDCGTPVLLVEDDSEKFFVVAIFDHSKNIGCNCDTAVDIFDRSSPDIVQLSDVISLLSVL